MMRNEDNELFSGLKTLSSFDNGNENWKDNNCTVAIGLTGKESQHFSPSSILVESLIEQLCKMIEKDAADQKALYLMICDKLHTMKLIGDSYCLDEYEFMRSHYQRALYNLLFAAKTNHQLAKINRRGGSNSPPIVINSKVPSLNTHLELSLPENILEWSRYKNEFLELEFIARGGFGQVYKAHHKLDGNVYAIKKIHLRYQNANGFLQSLREVKMLARLNHPNIVAYKAAWLEPFDKRSTKHNRVATIVFDDNSETNESSDIVFAESKFTNSRPNNFCTSKFNLMTNSDSSSSSSSGCSAGLAVCKYRGVDVQNKVDRPRISRTESRESFRKRDWATLYVQMQLCEENMREWLDGRNRSLPVNVDIDIKQCLSVFVKILKGIIYIHDKGIVHHDIKPSNIFVSKDLDQVQVGDFGLACCFLTHTAAPAVGQQSTKHKGRIGTKLYAAPEQIDGDCCAKSDIYSLGIVLLELLQPFQTEMERSKVISQLKRGTVPTDLTAKWPNLIKIISQMISVSKKKRPTASELFSMVCDEEKILLTAESLYEKERIITLLREEIAAKDEEILRLKQKLNEITH